MVSCKRAILVGFSEVSLEFLLSVADEGDGTNNEHTTDDQDSDEPAWEAALDV
jgi:hypothetical protein